MTPQPIGVGLQKIALTGARDGLRYVSPKTGRAVTREAGEPWKDRLLALPRFMSEGRADLAPSADVCCADAGVRGAVALVRLAASVERGLFVAAAVGR